MSEEELLEELDDSLKELQSATKLFYDNLKRLKSIPFNRPFFERCEAFMDQQNGRVKKASKISKQFSKKLKGEYSNYFKRVNTVLKEDVDCCKLLNSDNEKVLSKKIEKHENFLSTHYEKMGKMRNQFQNLTNRMNTICKNYKENLIKIEEEDLKELEKIQNCINEMIMKKEESEDGQVEKEPSFLYNDNVISSGLTVELVLQYPNSYFYREYSSNRRTIEGDVFVDHDSKFDELIVKYMSDDPSLEQDIKELCSEQKLALLNAIEWFELPLKNYIVCQLDCNSKNQTRQEWKKKRVIMVNGKECNEFDQVLIKNNLFDSTFNREILNNIDFYKSNGNTTINLELKYSDIIVDYLKHGNRLNTELMRNYKWNNGYHNLIEEFAMVGIHLDDDTLTMARKFYYESLFNNHLTFLDYQQYYLAIQQWFEYKYEWKLVYKASEHNYSAYSFHECCDHINGPTLILIQSTERYIFGAYTTRSWSGGIYVDTRGSVESRKNEERPTSLPLHIEESLWYSSHSF